MGCYEGNDLWQINLSGIVSGKKIKMAVLDKISHLGKECKGKGEESIYKQLLAERKSIKALETH